MFQSQIIFYHDLAFSFDEMVHGNALIENKIKQSLDTPNRYTANLRVSTLSPLKEHISKESTRLRSPLVQSKKNEIQSNALILKVCNRFKTKFDFNSFKFNFCTVVRVFQKANIFKENI